MRLHLGRYRLLSQLTTSPDGITYRACDEKSQLMVEIRVLSGARADIDRWKLLSKRLRIAALLEHSAVASIQELSLAHDPPYIVLPCLPTSFLATTGGKESLWPPTEALELGRNLASALVKAHRLGLWHGHLCPWAVRLTENRQPIIDFTATATSELPVGPDPIAEITASCYPPEARALSDAAGDVYSLGALLSWLLRGLPAQATLNRQETEPKLRLGQGVSDQASPSFQSTLQGFLLQMLATEPTERPSAKAIEDYLTVLLGAGGGSNELGAENQATIVLPPLSKITGRERLGRFLLREKIGEGGLGEVYRAEDTVDGSVVAIKVIHQQWAGRSAALRRFQKEARLLAEVKNPYVANLIEVNEDDGVHYLVLEYVPGRSLSQYLAIRQRLSEVEALSCMANVARALVDAHRRDIIHRDIKPDNIILIAKDGSALTDGASYTPQVKLCDFGLARHIVESDSLNVTGAGSVVGTSLYMAPEQGSGQGQVDARSDIYSMGATLFFLLAGRPPFQADSALKLLELHANEPPPSLQKLNPEVSDGACLVVAKALAKRPGERYADAGEFLEDVERLLRGEPTTIMVHPQLPACDPRRLLKYDWSWELEASPEQLWPFVSNTDRLNRAIGLPSVHATAVADPNGGARRFGQFRNAGVTSAWEEHPFEWIEGRRHGVLRECSQGPFKWLMSQIELTRRAGGGTLLTHQIRCEPHGWFGRLVAGMEIGYKGRRNVERVYRRIDAVLTGKLRGLPATDPFEEPAWLTTTRRNHLQTLLDKLLARGLAPSVVGELGAFLQYAPPQEVGRIRPLALASRLGLDPEQVVAACLYGACEGLLLLLWDVVCPVCRVPTSIKDTLASLTEHEHCAVCNLEFPVDFARSVEMIFRVHPEIRASDLGTYCIGGPAHSLHVVAQVRVAPAERLELLLELGEGSYRLRGPQLPYVLEFRVQPSAPLSRWDLNLRRGLDPSLPRRLRIDRQLLVLTNDYDREVVVRVERTASHDDALTAARASSLALFRQLFPNEVLAPGRLASLATVTLFVAQLDRADDLYARLGDGRTFALIHDYVRVLADSIRQHGGALVRTIDDEVLAVFDEPAPAVRLAIDLPALLAAQPGANEPNGLSSLRLCLGIHRGSVLVATLNDHLDYFGTTVNLVKQLPQLAQGHELILTQAVTGDAQVDALLRQRKLATEILQTSLPGRSADLLLHRLSLSSGSET